MLKKENLGPYDHFPLSQITTRQGEKIVGRVIEETKPQDQAVISKSGNAHITHSTSYVLLYLGQGEIRAVSAKDILSIDSLN